MNDRYTRAATKRFSEWLRSEIAKRGMVPADLAREIGKPAGMVSKWCNGQDLPKPDSAVLIGEAMRIDLQQVFDAMALRARDDTWDTRNDIDPGMRYYAESYRRLLPEFKRVVKAQLKVLYDESEEEKQRRSKFR